MISMMVREQSEEPAHAYLFFLTTQQSFTGIMSSSLFRTSFFEVMVGSPVIVAMRSAYFLF